MDMPPEAAENLVALLREIVTPDQDVDVAVHPELRRVLVFAGDDVVLSCSFDDLIAGPGINLN
jgi:hypothetical protein